MGIDRMGPIGPLRPASETTARDSDRPEAAPPISPIRPLREDSIELSEQARALRVVPDEERETLVERLQRQVSSGTYQVDAERVAQQMVDRGDA